MSPNPEPRILFVTGRLAEFALRQVLDDLAPRAGFAAEVAVLPITVAALMTPKWAARHLDVPKGVYRVVLPGFCRGDLGPILEKTGNVPVELGPEDLRDLPRHFGAADDRLAMVRAAAAGAEGLEVSDLELRRGGDSYTADTLAELHRVELEDGVEVIVPTSSLVVGDQFVVRPGEKISTDGVVVEGVSAIDASMLTGEAVPVEVGPGAVVIDAATSAEHGKIIGDVAEDVRRRDDLTITPEKGGVGPLTVAALFDNVIRSARFLAEKNEASAEL